MRAKDSESVLTTCAKDSESVSSRRGTSASSPSKKMIHEEDGHAQAKT
jgi:hypothetical protein